MNILITGGTGLIGRALSAALFSKGHSITVLTRNPDKARDALHSGVLPVKWDGRSLDGWGHLIEETDAVINLAGESIAGDTLPAIFTHRWNNENKNRIRASRLNAGRALLSAIKNAKRKPRVFIQASAVGFYGPRGDEEISENTPAGSDFLAETCRIWEDSTAEIENMGIRRVIIRTGLVLAPKGGILPLILLPFRLFVGGPLGSGDQFVSWIHIKDQVNAIRFLLENEGAGGVYNFTTPYPVRQHELATIAGGLMRRPSFFPVPGFALKLVLGEKSILVLDGQRTFPEKLIADGFHFRYENLKTALNNLI